jgi:hypothetical protein
LLRGPRQALHRRIAEALEQRFPDFKAYGVERWLAELALALRKETYRPEPIRRVFILTITGEHLHAPVRAGVEEARP